MSFLLVDYITPKHKNSVEQNRQWNLTGGRSKDARDEARQNAHGLNLCRLIVSTEQTMEFNRKQGCKTKKIGRGPAISARTHSISFLFFLFEASHFMAKDETWTMWCVRVSPIMAEPWTPAKHERALCTFLSRFWYGYQIVSVSRLSSSKIVSCTYFWNKILINSENNLTNNRGLSKK
jgi:hypothetical protein